MKGSALKFKNAFILIVGCILCIMLLFPSGIQPHKLNWDGITIYRTFDYVAIVVYTVGLIGSFVFYIWIFISSLKTFNALPGKAEKSKKGQNSTDDDNTVDITNSAVVSITVVFMTVMSIVQLFILLSAPDMNYLIPDIIGIISFLYSAVGIIVALYIVIILLCVVLNLIPTKQTPVKNKDASVVGRAVVGGIIAGPVGAIVGAISASEKNRKNQAK